MARRKQSSGLGGIAFAFLLVLGVIQGVLQSTVDFVSANREIFTAAFWVLLAISVVVLIIMCIVTFQRDMLYDTVLRELDLTEKDLQLNTFDARVVVKNRQALDNYSESKYLRSAFTDVRKTLDDRISIIKQIEDFLSDNRFQQKAQYEFVKQQLTEYTQRADTFKVLVVYITAAGNKRGEKTICINRAGLLTSGEKKELKQQVKAALEEKKQSLYARVNEVIAFANAEREGSQSAKIDELVQKLFTNTVGPIQRTSNIDSAEWQTIESYITLVEEQIKNIVQVSKLVGEYYETDAFVRIKETCAALTQSQKEFNDYITEKSRKISQLFGTRIVRNETQNQDVFSYVRAYKKSITPFTAEVSSSVFGSAENDPIGYIVKYFYPNPSQYPEQIEKLRVLISELETLREAKEIIDNYKKDYDRYIKDVPAYVLEYDEDGFYSRLGVAVIDEAVLNVEYKFAYTSDGGMAQRSFTVPMNEENITALIERLESKMSLQALAKEQRALMTAKLRAHIKSRDNYTCRQCGNSIYKEPNLLLEVDHIIPISKGGLTQEDNLQTLCWKCNRNKGARLIS